MRTIWANALLSNGEILFWYTGSECTEWYDFYKDFYYADIDAIEYEKTHDLQIAKIGFVDCTDDKDYNELIFETLAENFYRQFPISTDSRGSKPY